IFQDYKLLKQKSVWENLSFVMEAAGFRDSEIKRDIPVVLELVRLEDKIDYFPEELSAGEKQRLAIARALIHRPTLLLADEPTGNLDPYNTFEILKIFKKINRMGTTIILATHNKEVVDFLKKRIIVLEKGKLIRDDKKGKYTF
ncbi:ATP-binding cassette domain-containing protein, partial [Candidatus Parcubacteria bacterium]|nr:ATP-binding cassette domain-containing protein [Candidatus Parcubacteria bacterium]